MAIEGVPTGTAGFVGRAAGRAGGRGPAGHERRWSSARRTASGDGPTWPTPSGPSSSTAADACTSPGREGADSLECGPGGARPGWTRSHWWRRPTPDPRIGRGCAAAAAALVAHAERSRFRLRPGRRPRRQLGRRRAPVPGAARLGSRRPLPPVGRARGALLRRRRPAPAVGLRGRRLRPGRRERGVSSRPSATRSAGVAGLESVARPRGRSGCSTRTGVNVLRAFEAARASGCGAPAP